MTSAISCCNFPTSLLLIDDDKDFVEGLKYGIRKQYKSVCVNNIDEARELINNNQGCIQKLWDNNTVSRVYLDADPGLFSVSVDVSLLKNHLYNPNRFNHFAIILVDYDMPEQNGIDFIRSLEDDQIKFIMLTGKASQDIVIKAFNNKEIDRYVSKGDPNYIETILQYIKELQNEFFAETNKFIIDSLKMSETKVFSNKAYRTLFNKIIQENKIVEYYLLDELGSFFFQDAEAKNQIWFILKSEEELRYLFELACNDKDSPVYTIQKLRDRQILPYFNNAEERNFPTKLWNLVDAQPLDDSNQYYYALVNNSKDFDIDKFKIKTYLEFLQESK